MNIIDLIIALETLLSDYGGNVELYVPKNWKGFSLDRDKEFIMNFEDVLDLNGKFHNLQNGSGGDEYIVEQYTGLKDKNGKEIYEGDIVKLKWICNLLQQPEGGIIGSVDCCQGVYRIKKYTMLGNYVDGNNEIIGNINENPELLKNMN